VETITTAGIVVGVVVVFVELIKFFINKFAPDKAQDDITEIKKVVYEIKGALEKHELRSEYSAKAQEDISHMIRQMSTTQEKMAETMERVVKILDKIDLRHE